MILKTGVRSVQIGKWELNPSHSYRSLEWLYSQSRKMQKDKRKKYPLAIGKGGTEGEGREGSREGEANQQRKGSLSDSAYTPGHKSWEGARRSFLQRWQLQAGSMGVWDSNLQHVLHPGDSVSLSAWAAITKDLRCDGWNNRHLFSRSEAWKSKI